MRTLLSFDFVGECSPSWSRRIENHSYFAYYTIPIVVQRKWRFFTIAPMGGDVYLGKYLLFKN
jgi:hypothetical protein